MYKRQIVNAVNDGNCDDGLLCNGAETCDASLGCLTGTEIDCSDLDSFCATGVCPEDAQGCEAQPVNEGEVCGEPADACTIELVCLEGECVDVPTCDPECEFCEGEGVCRNLCANPYQPEQARVSVSDALVALRAAVDLDHCATCKCDVTGDHEVMCTDALMILQHAVEFEVAMDCPIPGQTTTTMTVETSTTTAFELTTTTLLID